MKIHQEEWKPIAECNGEYYVSNLGRVKSFKFGKERVLKHCVNTTGYLYIGTRVNGKRKICKIHRLVAMAFINNPNNKSQVNHIDGNKMNNYVCNLEWATPKENHQHAWDTGLNECKRLAISKANSKPVLDIQTGKKYDSLRKACEDIGEPYSRHEKRHSGSSKLQRFFYL
jgi:hypothetical protein